MELLAGFIIGLVLGLGFGYEHGKEKATAALKKLEAVKNEIEMIEKTWERRLIVEIHKVTARLKPLL